MKFLKILLLLLFAGVLVYAASDLPYRGDPDNVMHKEISITGSEVIGSYAIRESYKETNTPNMVTVILGDYRSIDTFGEQVVIYTAGLITLLILRRKKKES